MKRIILSILISAILILTVTACKNEGYVIGVSTGTTYQELAETLGKVSEVKTLKNDNFTLQELNDERVDAVITDRLLGLSAIKNGGFNDLTIVGDVIYNETIAVTINKKDKSLRQAINIALSKIIKNGTYEKISQKYFNKNILKGFDYTITYPNEKKSTDDSLKKVQKSGVIKFAMSGGYPPFNYYDKDVLTGFDVEIGKAVAKELGVKYQAVTTDWSGIIEGLRSGRYDGIFGSMAITEKRKEVVSFTNPYYFSGAQLIVKKDSPIKGVEDLKSE